MKKQIILCTAVVLALLLSGCRTAELDHESSKNSTTSSFESSTESEAAQPPTDVVGSSKEFSMAYGEIWTPSEEKLKDVFGFSPDAEMNEVSKTGHTVQDDDKILSFDQGMVSFIYPNSKIVNSALFIFRNNIAESNYNADKFSQTEDLDFSTKSEAIQALTDLLQQIGKDESYQITAYALDAQTMKEQEQVLKSAIGEISSDMPMVDRWDSSSESYYLQAVPTVDGYPLLPITTGNYENGSTITNEMITAIYTSSGFELFMMANGVNITSIVKSENELIGENQAKETFNQLNLALLSTETYQVESLQLGYYSEYANADHTEIVFKPAWQAKTIASGEDESKDSGQYSYYLYQYIDAESGQEIVEALG